ncbi:hypothetical protein BS78_03G089500 [Paspalum vaginatum]|nr:hypothetical protein BS78_03G089500 [Paspalum vaginatum]
MWTSSQPETEPATCVASPAGPAAVGCGISTPGVLRSPRICNCVSFSDLWWPVGDENGRRHNQSLQPLGVISQRLDQQCLCQFKLETSSSNSDRQRPTVACSSLLELAGLLLAECLVLSWPIGRCPVRCAYELPRALLRSFVLSKFC